MNIKAFQKIVLDFYEKEQRTFLWRDKPTPYHVLVSEIMLQQTQADRVVPYFKKFVKAYPTVRKLAAAKRSDVLKLWQGLGYNRRGIALHEAAKQIVERYNGKIPSVRHDLQELPGIGPYTAGAILAFAHNAPVLFIETNIRTVYFHHFFINQENVSDEALLSYVEKTLYTNNPRLWYSALMDYGAHLKRMGKGQNSKSKHYTKQSTFKGSDREVRGWILRRVIQSGVTVPEIQKTFPDTAHRIEDIVSKLVKEGVLQRKGKKYILKEG